MGNRQGNQKEDGKSRGDKIQEKDSQKKQKKSKTIEKKDSKKRQHRNVSDLEAEVDESSHVTGGDSESCIFHSAENISCSLNTDTSTGFEHKQGSTCSGGTAHSYMCAQHPYVLSSTDFQDGFSLEACIPPEISRPESHSSTPLASGRQRHSIRSLSSAKAKKPDSEAVTTGRGSLSPVIAGSGYSTTVTSASSAEQNAKLFPLVPTTLTYTDGKETDEINTHGTHPSPTSGIHHPHFYNHHYHPSRKYKPVSPPAQPKYTSPSQMLISAQNLPTSPTAIVGQHRSGNFLSLFRSNSKNERTSSVDGGRKQENCTPAETSRTFPSTNEELKTKSKPTWKTWERSNSSQLKPKVSIFGTSRKTENNISRDGDKQIKEFVMMETSKQVEVLENLGSSFKSDTHKEINKCYSPSKPAVFNDKFHKSCGSFDKNEGNSDSINLSSDDYPKREWSNVNNEDETRVRESSPLLSTTAAFCIMKLEELERSIEKTIREKFPDAEPFLMRKRSKEELRGSRSLPTTPSLKKKLYIAREEDTGIDDSRIGDDKGNTRFCDETYESPPSPAKSPVVIRRFGARTRHASMSPKIQRAKTALLFNSPSEVPNLETSLSAKLGTKIPMDRHKLLNEKNLSETLSSPFTDKPLTVTNKSESKYDNVTSSETSDNYNPLVYDQTDIDGDIAANIPLSESNKTGTEQQPVILPTFSAVFGSVSPKLKRHNRVKFSDNKSSDEDKTLAGENVSSQIESGNIENKVSTRAGNVSMKKTENSGVLLASSVGRLDSSKNLRFVNRSDKVQKERTGGVVTECLGNVSVRSKQRTQDLMAELESVSINRSAAAMCAGSHEDAAENCNTVKELITSQHTTGKGNKCVGENRQTSLKSSKPSRIETLPSTRPPGKILEKIGQLESPGTVRKNSTTHVILGSDIALPCQALPSSPGEEATNGIKISNLAHAQSTIPHPGHGMRNQSQHYSITRAENNIKQVPFGCNSRISVSSSSKNTESVTNDSSQKSSQAEVSDNISFKDSQLEVIRNALFEKDSDVLCNRQNIIRRVDDSDIVNSVFPNKEGYFKSEFSADFQSSKTKKKTILNEKSSSTDENIRCHEQRCSDYEKPLQDNPHNHSKGSQEETVTILKQPVSEVISQMINLSKCHPEHFEQEYNQLRQRSFESNTTAQNNDVIHTQPSVAMVTISTYEQPCQILEQRTVNSETNISTSFNQDLYNSRCQEIQTDSYTTADKSVDSGSLTETLEKSEKFTTGQTNFSVPHTARLVTQMAGSDDNKFLKGSLSEDRTQSKHVDGTEAKEQVPPPSPTLMRQTMAELQEEEIEDSDDSNRDAVTCTQQDYEIKQFTQNIYKRLSDLLGSQTKNDNTESDDFVNDDAEKDDFVNVVEKSSMVNIHRDSVSAESDNVVSQFDINADSPSNVSVSNHAKVLTIETSSSLSTTTSSDSEVDERHRRFKTFGIVDQNDEDSFEAHERYLMDEVEQSETVFREQESNTLSTNPGHGNMSRVYHSDDDVATGRGIPDYYDDRPLWTRRQKPPGELSAAMMAIRWRERRERWLKKRKRNRTDLLSTGSSDTGSENCLARDYSLIGESLERFENENPDNKYSQINIMGSGILTSPKYTKPILPFFDTGQTRSSLDGGSQKDIRNRLEPLIQHTQRHNSTLHQSSNTNQMSFTVQDENRNNNGDYENIEKINDKDGNNSEKTEHCLITSVNRVAPTIEDTFQELISVQNILVGMQEWKRTDSEISERKCLPLTTENVRFIRDYDKDCYLTASGRRSRLSATDRTESDLDLYSEMRDDASSDSEVYADDEGDDEGLEQYATAEDEHCTAGRRSNSGGRGNKRGAVLARELDDGVDKSIVHTCTFYNSNTHREQSHEVNDVTSLSSETKSPQRSTSIAHASTSQPVTNSDEEFWTGSVIVDESYQQLETTTDAVSSTFQNARDQMHDIQHHLQALRRQMEIMQDDLTHISITLSPNTSRKMT